MIYNPIKYERLMAEYLYQVKKIRSHPKKNRNKEIIQF